MAVFYVFVEQSLRSEKGVKLRKRASPAARLETIANPGDSFVFNYARHGEVELAGFIMPHSQKDDAQRTFDKFKGYRRHGEVGRCMVIAITAWSARRACFKLVKNDFVEGRTRKGICIEHFEFGDYEALEFVP